VGLLGYINKYGVMVGTLKHRQRISKVGTLFTSLSHIEEYVKNKTNEFDSLLPWQKISKKIPNYAWDLVDKPDDIRIWLQTFIKFRDPVGKIVIKSTASTKYTRSHYTMHVDDKFLRSSNEILFYQLLTDAGLIKDKDYIIEKLYPLSPTNHKCDFYLIKGNIYIELAGSTDDAYVQHMKYKESTFNAVCLWSQNSYEKFIKDYVDDYYNR
jgi:hypothetical protein